MLIVKRKENATSAKFSRRVSFTAWKWPKWSIVVHPIEEQPAWRAVNNHGKRNYRNKSPVSRPHGQMRIYNIYTRKLAPGKGGELLVGKEENAPILG